MSLTYRIRVRRLALGEATATPAISGSFGPLGLKNAYDEANRRATRRPAEAGHGRTAPVLTSKITETKRGSGHAVAAPIPLGTVVRG